MTSVGAHPPASACWRWTEDSGIIRAVTNDIDTDASATAALGEAVEPSI